MKVFSILFKIILGHCDLVVKVLPIVKLQARRNLDNTLFDKSRLEKPSDSFDTLNQAIREERRNMLRKAKFRWILLWIVP